MAVWLYPTQTPGLTLYSVAVNGVGLAWNESSSTYETFDTHARSQYALTTAETGTMSGIYLVTIPSSANFVSATYTVVVYEQSGGSPATSDTANGSGSEVWDGGTSPPPTPGTLPTPAMEFQPPAPLASNLSSSPGRMKVGETRLFTMDFDTQNELLSNGDAAIAGGAVVSSDDDGLTVGDTDFGRTELGAYLTAVTAGSYTLTYTVSLNDTGGTVIYRDGIVTVEA